MNNYKKYFPIYTKQPELVYLDSAATTLKPQSVIDVVVDYYSNYSANIHRGLYSMSEKATEKYEEVRDKVKEFINAEFRDEIIFTSGTTDSINLVAGGWGEKNLSAGEEIVVTMVEHHSNLVPWQQLAKRQNLKLKFWQVNSYQLSVNRVKELINKNTKLLAITSVSNVAGQINPIKDIIKEARKINPDIVVVVDAAQAVAHMPLDVKDMDCDFLAFSGHKMYGPTGVGVLYAKTKRMNEMEPTKYGGGMISDVDLEKAEWAQGAEKFEAGTPPIGQVIGLGAAVDFIESIGWNEIMRHESELTEYTLSKLKEIKDVKILGSSECKNRLGVISIYLEDSSPHDYAYILGEKYDVAVRGGMHCAIPMHRAAGVDNGTTRVSIGIYNTKEDIDNFVKGLKGAIAIMEGAKK